jgi:hypothetical protein
MMYVVCVLVGLMAGGAAAYFFMRRLAVHEPAPIDLRAMRWEKVPVRLTSPALRHLRRHYPTHDLLTCVPMMSLLATRGPQAEDVARHCAAWSAAVVMVDKRTGGLGRVIVWSADPLASEKAWMLRRVGYRVTLVDEDGEETAMLDAMAA